MACGVCKGRLEVEAKEEATRQMRFRHIFRELLLRVYVCVILSHKIRMKDIKYNFLLL